MIVLAFPADEAERIVNGEQTVATYPDEWCRLPTRRVVDEWRLRLDSLVGQPVAIASQGNWIVTSPVIGGPAKYPHGAIVGSATVAAVQQRVGEDRGQVGWAVILTDAAPCEQRCPRCGWLCFCGSSGIPIPYSAPGPVSEWTP